jgi:hypothetical protein
MHLDLNLIPNELFFILDEQSKGKESGGESERVEWLSG